MTRRVFVSIAVGVHMPRAKGQLATIIAIDPGVTTGVCVLTLDPAWLNGSKGPATWVGLGFAVRSRYVVQIGRYPRSWSDDDGRARNTSMGELDAIHLPVLPDQPLDEEDTSVFATFADIVSGRGKAGGGALTNLDANEARQVRQIAGLLDNHPKAALVLESFDLRTMAGGKALLSPERLNAAIRTEEILHGVGRTPFMQQPSYAKATATDARIKRARLHYPGMVHGTDAARHAATFARDLRQSPGLRHAAFPRHPQFHKA